MKKKIILCCAAVAVVLVLILVLFPVFSRLVYGRSQAATVFTWQLKKDAYTTEEKFQTYLDEKREENGAEYELPCDEWLDGEPELRQYGDLSCYVLNASASSGRVILYFPGGSFIDAPREVHWKFLDSLAQDTGAEIAVPLYPLLPDADAETAYAALTEFYGDFAAGLPDGELIFMGDSAGGGMAVSFAMLLRDAGQPGPDKLILLSPWLDVTLSDPDIPAYEKKDPALDSEQLRHLGVLWAGDLELTDPVVSPLYGSFEGLGRISLFTGTAELLYPDIMRLDEKLTEAGIEHDTLVSSGMFHVWPVFFSYHIPESEESYADIVRLVTG